MEKVVVELEFLYAPQLGHCAAIVSTKDDRTQMSLEELKQQYPMLCDGLSQMFSTKPDNPEWAILDMDNWECGEGTLHSSTDSCNCAEYQ